MQSQRTGRAPSTAANTNANANANPSAGQHPSTGTPGASTPFPSASAYKFEYPCSEHPHARPTSPEPAVVSAQDTQAFADSLTKALKKAKPFAITISIKTPPSILAKRRNARSQAASRASSSNASLCPSTIASSVASSKHSPIMDARSHRSEDDFALGL